MTETIDQRIASFREQHKLEALLVHTDNQIMQLIEALQAQIASAREALKYCENMAYAGGTSHRDCIAGKCKTALDAISGDTVIKGGE